jgi:hypothetical protein
MLLRGAARAGGAAALAGRRGGGVVARGGAVARSRGAQVVRGGHGGLPAPSFVPRQVPDGPLHEQADLIWDDGVAPEVTIDFDAPGVSRGKGFLMWLGGLGFFASVYGFVAFVQRPDEGRLAMPARLGGMYDEEEIAKSLGGHKEPEHRLLGH